MGKKSSREAREKIAAAVSDAELEVLECLWVKSPLSAQEIISRLDDAGPANPRTVKTLINRLLNKGALEYSEENRKYHYFPTISRNDFYQEKTSSFLDKFFDGQVSPFLSFFSSRKRLSAEEIEELKALIEKLEADGDQ